MLTNLKLKKRLPPMNPTTNEILRRRKLYLAVPDTVFGELFEGEKGEIVMSDERLKVFCFSPETEEILIWKR